MAPTKLKCTFGDSCQYETQEQEFAQSKELLESHLKYAHPVQGGGNNDRKPEKFPRPEIKLESSAEEWSEFLVTWDQYKEEYQLGGPSLIRQLFACCSEELRHSLSRTTGGTHFAKTEPQLLALIALIKQDRDLVTMAEISPSMAVLGGTTMVQTPARLVPC